MLLNYLPQQILHWFTEVIKLTRQIFPLLLKTKEETEKVLQQCGENSAGTVLHLQNSSSRSWRKSLRKNITLISLSEKTSLPKSTLVRLESRYLIILKRIISSVLKLSSLWKVQKRAMEVVCRNRDVVKNNLKIDRVWSLAIALCNSGIVIVLKHQAILYY